jgi:hypothetical protein
MLGSRFDSNGLANLCFSAEDSHVRCLRTFRSLRNFKLHLVSFVKNLEPVLLNGGEMNKNITPVFSGNEPIAFLLIEPFNMTFGHYNSPPLLAELA